MLLYREKLLSNGQLKRLSDHLYNCENIGFLDKYLQPFWNFLISKTPLWLAPNVITLSGLLVNVVTTLILVWYSPDARAEAPRWACLVCAIGLFMYQSLDAIDGKQARRTGTSNPLGELFDHGCDSLSTVFVALSACIAVQLGHYPTWMFFQCFCAMTLFYCAHWQTYVSGTMKFGRVDVTEAQCTIILIHIISAIFGPSVWMMEVDFFFKWELRYLIALMTIICCSVNVYQVFTVIVSGGVGKNGSTVAIPFLPGCQYFHLVVYTIVLGFLASFSFFWKNFEEGGAGKNGSTVAVALLHVELKFLVILFTVVVYGGLAYSKIQVIFGGGVGKNGSTVAGTSVLSPIIPFSLVIVPAYIIYKKSDNQLYENNPALYILAFGMVSAKVTNRLVVAHMTKNELDYLDTALVGPAMLFLNQYFNFFFDEYYVLWACLFTPTLSKRIAATATGRKKKNWPREQAGQTQRDGTPEAQLAHSRGQILLPVLPQIWVTLDLMRYSIEICHEICDYLKVKLFRIPYPNMGSTGKLVSNKSPSNGQHQTQPQSEEEERLIRLDESRSSGKNHRRGSEEGESEFVSLGTI